jgi:uncharacterized cupredoxin-like copper-binding protein
MGQLTDAPSAHTTPTRRSVTTPAVASWLVVAAYKAAAALRDGLDSGELVAGAVLVAIAAVVTVVVYGLLVRKALDSPSARPGTVGTMLGGLGVVLIVAFWSGLPVVLGGAALVLGMEARRRRSAGATDGLPAAVAMVVGLLAITGNVASVVLEEAAKATAPLRVEAMEYGYLLPRSIPAGVVTVDFANAGDELHEFALIRLEEGRDAADILAAFESDQEPDWWDGASLPGVPLLSPGRELSLTFSLDAPGTYAFFCPLPTAEFVPHMALGMVGTFEVAGDSDGVPPIADVVITATDDGFDVPSIRAGDVTVELRNAGRRPHEFSLAAYAQGRTAADVEAWFESGQRGPAPVTFVGGIQSIPPGTAVLQRLVLQDRVTYTLEDFTSGFDAAFTAR